MHGSVVISPRSHSRLTRSSQSPHASRRGGYKGYKGYLGRAKEMHVLAGHPWDTSLELSARKSATSVLRGLGVERQSAPFDLAVVLKTIEEGKVCLRDSAPIGWANFVVIATFFMMREIEAAAAQAGHVTVAEEEQRVSVRLPVSKKDPRAVGCTRSWACLCREGSIRRDCPYHAAVA